MKRLSVRGKRFKIVDSAKKNGCELLGYCTNHSLGDAEIMIPIEGDEKDDLIVIIHEILHAALWDLSEETVEETSVDIGEALWRLKWRKED